MEKGFSFLRVIMKVLCHQSFSKDTFAAENAFVVRGIKQCRCSPLLNPLTSALKERSLFLRAASKSTEITTLLQMFGCIPFVYLELKLNGCLGKIICISKVIN